MAKTYAIAIDGPAGAGKSTIAKALAKAVPCIKVGVAVIGIDVPHAHIHLVPINGVGDLDFKKERVVLSEQEFKDLAAKIAQEMK